MFKIHPCVACVSGSISCLWPNDTSLNKYTTICLSTQELMNIRVTFQLFKVCLALGGGLGRAQATGGASSPSPSSASSEPPPHSLQGSARNLPLMAPSPWSVGGGLHLPSLPQHFSSYPRPHLVSSLPSPSFPTFSVVQRDHHSLPDLLPLQPCLL